jgi:hypothetical protein
MTKQRTFRLLAPLMALGVGLGIAGNALAGHAGRAQEGGFSINRGDSKETSGVTWESWGSGRAEDVTQYAYSGQHSLKIYTQGYYQGATLNLAKPANLGTFTANRDAYLQIAVLVPQAAGAGGRPGGPPPGGPPGLGGASGGGRPGAGGLGGAGRGRGGAGTGRNAKAKEPKNLANLRVVLMTTDNQPLEFLLPLETATEDKYWKLLDIPVAMIPGIKPDTQIKAIQLFGDQPETFYLGQIRVVIDATPISVDPIMGKVFPKNESYQFIGKASAGYTPLRYSWDWDVSDGIQDDGEGRVISHAYHKSGDFTAALTVSDVYGIKAPVTVKFSVNVTP